jgi:hypothetical protein
MSNNGDLEVQQYLYDLQGYLVIENALSADVVAELNEIIDKQELPDGGRNMRFGGAAGSLPETPGFLDWGKSFCDLLDHAAIMPILRFVLGDCFRLDRLYGMKMTEGMPRGHMHADYGATAPHSGAKPGERYHVRENEIAAGFAVVAWNLSDTGPEQGGFCCIPGSHKSSFVLPKQITDSPEKSPCVVIPRASAGSVSIFTEALTHGTAAWRAPHERRTLLLKYCVSHTAWSSKRVKPPTATVITPRQEILFKEPADPHRFFPSLFEDLT